MTLATYIHRHNLDPLACMNDLQDNGIISDLCVHPSDVSPHETPTAILWLNQRKRSQPNLYVSNSKLHR